ncbi:MAG: hypothetical protein JSU94_19195 [Phycisphaerales bacterium]|nr:MAG: hypothetical protein JSU94_19195 [Phycisphaerales bacterium]
MQPECLEDAAADDDGTPDLKCSVSAIVCVDAAAAAKSSAAPAGVSPPVPRPDAAPGAEAVPQPKYLADAPQCARSVSDPAPLADAAPCLDDAVEPATLYDPNQGPAGVSARVHPTRPANLMSGPAPRADQVPCADAVLEPAPLHNPAQCAAAAWDPEQQPGQADLVVAQAWCQDPVAWLDAVQDPVEWPDAVRDPAAWEASDFAEDTSAQIRTLRPKMPVETPTSSNDMAACDGR